MDNTIKTSAEWESPELVELGDASAIVRGAGDCCPDHGVLQGDKDAFTDRYDDLT